MTPEENKQLILTELDRLYPQPKPELHFTNPYETLVAVMLSAQCTDKQVNKVTPELFRRWPTPQAMAHAPEKSCCVPCVGRDMATALAMAFSRSPTAVRPAAATRIDAPLDVPRP